MINFETFMLGLFVTATLAGLMTEAVKKILNDLEVKYHSNVVAGVVSFVLAIGIGVCYVIVANLGFTSHTIVYIAILAVLSWLASMVGYDKVTQVITQIKNNKKG